jgi:deoxyribose-phosphate aldolase
VHAELHALRAAASKSTLKLILETSRLTSSQIVQASVIAGRNDFDFIKTSTGFHGEGAKVKDVGVMRACAEVLAQLDAGSAKKMRVKASGGIRDLGQAEVPKDSSKLHRRLTLVYDREDSRPRGNQ